MLELRELVARYWPEGSVALATLALVGRYVYPPTLSAFRRAWDIHARLAKLEADASALEARLRDIEHARTDSAVSAAASTATLTTEVAALARRFEDVRQTMAADLRDLRDETRVTLAKVEATIADLTRWTEGAQFDERLRRILREELNAK